MLVDGAKIAMALSQCVSLRKFHLEIINVIVQHVSTFSFELFERANDGSKSELFIVVCESTL